MLEDKMLGLTDAFDEIKRLSEHDHDNSAQAAFPLLRYSASQRTGQLCMAMCALSAFHFDDFNVRRRAKPKEGQFVRERLYSMDGGSTRCLAHRSVESS
jgi:hypothetical protein